MSKEKEVTRIKKSKLKEQDFSWITFDDFVAEIKQNTKPPYWSGMINKVPYTHENDSLYLIGFGDNQVRFHKGEVLCFTEKRLFILNHPMVDFISVDDVLS